MCQYYPDNTLQVYRARIPSMCAKCDICVLDSFRDIFEFWKCHKDIFDKAREKPDRMMVFTSDLQNLSTPLRLALMTLNP